MSELHALKRCRLVHWRPQRALHLFPHLANVGTTSRGAGKNHSLLSKHQTLHKAYSSARQRHARPQPPCRVWHWFVLFEVSGGPENDGELRRRGQLVIPWAHLVHEIRVQHEKWGDSDDSQREHKRVLRRCVLNTYEYVFCEESQWGMARRLFLTELII